MNAFNLKLLMLLLCLSLALPALSQDESSEDVDYLALAALLIGDGNYDRAETVLASVDETADNTDLIRLYTLRGLVALNKQQLERAVADFDRAFEAGQSEPIVYLYKAQALFGLERWQETIEAFSQAGEQAANLPSVSLILAQCHWKLGEKGNAFNVLLDASARFPDRAGEFVRRAVFYYIEEGLYKAASDVGWEYLQTTDAGVQDFIAIGNALCEAKEHKRALGLLEYARLIEPQNVDVAKVLARCYLQQNEFLAAAEILNRASTFDPSLISETSELYRRAGRVILALTLNGQIADQEKKLKQRLAILIQLERFEQATSMEENLYRNGLLEDEDIRYALAYAYFKIGEYQDSERHLTQLTRSDLFRKAIELRRVIEECAEEVWKCA